MSSYVRTVSIHTHSLWWRMWLLLNHPLFNLDIQVSGVRGKVLEYLKRFKPHHYSALEECGLLQRKVAA